MSNSNLSSNDKENLGPSNMERFARFFLFKANFLFVTDVFKLKKTHTEICLERVHAILL